jgi:hypothetical protein
MKSRMLVIMCSLLVCCGVFMSQVSFAAAQNSDNKSTSKSEEMAKKRKAAADKIITKMIDNGSSKTDISIQKKKNKELYGFEGEYLE